jgi:hypothetical protein
LEVASAEARILGERSDALLAEVEDIIRCAPTLDAYSADSGSDEHLAWMGRAAAAVERWDPVKGPRLEMALSQVPSEYGDPCQKALSTVKTLLHQARADMALELRRGSIVVPQGHVFDYFDEVRKVIEQSRNDVFFVDPYLDAEFVSRYLTHVPAGVTIRLLTHPKRLPTLLPAVDALVTQSGARVSVRASETLHDRYVFVDRAACYLSGASFKDGAKKIASCPDANLRRLCINGGHLRAALG